MITRPLHTVLRSKASIEAHASSLSPRPGRPGRDAGQTDMENVYGRIDIPVLHMPAVGATVGTNIQFQPLFWHPSADRACLRRVMRGHLLHETTGALSLVAQQLLKMSPCLVVD